MMPNSVADTPDWFTHLPRLLSDLDEKQRRRVAGLISEILGHGRISRVAELSGLDPKTIRRGRKDLNAPVSACPKDRIRQVGAGRPPLKKTSRNLKIT